MKDYIIFMHRDALDQRIAQDPERWKAYFTWLRGTGQFDGGSSIGPGERLRKGQDSEPVADDLSGFIRVRAASLKDARMLLMGNPVYEAGGTIEIRKLPLD